MKKTSQKILLLLVVLISVSAMIDAYFSAHLIRAPAWLTIVSTVAMTAAVFAWYYFDSSEVGYARNKWLNIVVVAVALIGIPVYLFKSRAGRRTRSFLKLFGFLGIAYGVATLGALIVGIVSSI